MRSPFPSEISYFDYNATHPPFSELLELSLKEYLTDFYNPSGATRFSLRNQGKIESVRKYFSELTGKKESSLIFSSTGTEANYLLIQNLRDRFPELNEVIVSPFEHSSMYGALDDYGFEKKIISTNKSGKILLSSLETLLQNSPLPVICLMAGNETGVLQPVREISEIARSHNSPFFSDLMQAFGKTEVDFDLFDGFSFSSHKIGGGMGTAITSVCYDSKNFHLFAGGNQENGHRAGTENLPSILAFREASKLQLEELANKNKKLENYRIRIESSLKEWGCKIIAEDSNRLYNTSFVLLPIEELDFFLLGMEEKKIIISTGSSCKSRAREASGSLLAMGYSKEEALRCIRISTGYFTTEEEVKHLLTSFEELIEKFRSF
ncbi:cysteine desulfurase family protein [Leptospira idonii]|uniref:Aminotransferase class V-fold PLP-dependent enzyme n=1 Tax=Leptospira idonii TaxID=1193500 RepID=A0A4R9LZ42_9LEPT|nr:aminotransferase class V-fold PLP-dependent enzyme [Leptospira idonii]TGN18169.1 aminotransferase class V-fold PLP-dependent enzyme [Leptospira idonii]